MRHWAQRVWLVGPAQAMYEAVLRSLGASGYGPRFLDIARRLTWKESQQWLSGCDTAERPIVADALLLGTAGLLQQALEMSHAMDGETQVYVSALQHAWTHLPGDVQCLAGPQIDWQHPHVRPMNTPERRLAGMAQLLARYGDTDLYQAALVRCRASRGQTLTRRARSLNRALIDMLQMPTHTYWGARSRFGTRPGRLQRLIGRQRALTIVVDAMLPLLLCEAYAQGAGALQQLLLTGYREAPRLPDNATLRDMSRRLLGDDPPLLALVTHARHQQGMLQVFEDYCSHDEGGCQGCGFPPL